MKKIRKMVATMLALVLCIGVIGVQKPAEAEAASSAKWSRLKFIISTVDAMAGQYNNAGHKVTELKVNEDGSVTYTDNGDKVTSAKVTSIKKKYSTSLENAQKLAVAADMGIFKTTATAFKSAAKMKSKITYKTAMQVLTAADEYLYGKTLSDSDIKAIKKRISNLKKAGTSGYQTFMAKGFGLGYYVGDDDGDYSVTRTLKYSSKLSESTCNRLIGRLADKSERVKLTDDWQVIRTKGLPETAELYPYILDSFPNKYYDTSWNGIQYYMGSPKLENSYYYRATQMSFEERAMDAAYGFMWPAELKKYMSLSDSKCYVNSKYRQWSNVETVFDQVIEYYTYAMNVNYKTIEKDTEWRKVMSKYLSDEEIDAYIKDCKKYHIIVECDKVAGDVSACYWDGTGIDYKIYLHFRVVSDDVIKAGGGSDNTHGELVPCRNAGVDENWSRAFLMWDEVDYKLGKWTDYYVSPTKGSYDMVDKCALDYSTMLGFFGLYSNLRSGD